MSDQNQTDKRIAADLLIAAIAANGKILNPSSELLSTEDRAKRIADAFKVVYAAVGKADQDG